MVNNFDLNIHGIGMCCSLSDFHNACAANRVGFNRFTGSEYFAFGNQGEEEPTPLQIAPLPAYLEGYQGRGRYIKMLQLAYEDLKINLNSIIPDERVGLYLALPDVDKRNFTIDDEVALSESQQQAQIRELFLSENLNVIAPDLKPNKSECCFGERIVFIQMLQKSIEDLKNNVVDSCLLIGVDCLLDVQTLETLIEDDLVKSEENPNGFIPGEGAIALYFSQAVASENNVTLPLKLSIKTGMELMPTEDDWDIEEKFDDNEELVRQSWQAKVLSQLSRDNLKHLADKSEKLSWISDMNGSTLRATEAGLLRVKLQNHLPSLRFEPIQTPVVSFGELGIVTGGVYLALIVFSIARGYANSNYFLITLSEDSGQRASILVSS